jgi:hypothetical protein
MLIYILLCVLYGIFNIPHDELTRNNCTPVSGA